MSPQLARKARYRELWLANIAILGVVGLLFLVLRSGIANVISAFHRAGWLLVLLGPLHGIAIALDSQGWRVLLKAAGQRISRPYVVWAAAVRNATQSLMPIGVGGFVSGIRLLAIKRIRVTTSVASIVVEASLMIMSELAIVLVGILLYFFLFPASARFPVFLFPVLGADIVAAALIVWAQRDGRIFDKLAAAAKRITENERFKSLLASPIALKEEIQRIYAEPSVSFRCVGWQLVSLLAEAVELWVIMLLMRLPASFYFALLVQGLGRAARSIAFVVPAGIGVQEGVYAVLAPLDGFSPGLGIALSLATRFRDIVFGVPTLIWWQIVETRLRKTGQQLIP